MNLFYKIADERQAVSKTITFFSKLGLELAGYALILMTLLVALNTAFRVLPFVKALNFVEEYSGYFFVAISFLGLADTLRKGAHVRVTLIITKLRPKIRAAVDIITSFVGLIIIMILTYHALFFFLDTVISGERAQSVTETPLWIPQLFLIPGYVFLILELLLHLSKAVVKFKGTPHQQMI
jgi:TRAP-type transport system small permease protein